MHMGGVVNNVQLDHAAPLYLAGVLSQYVFCIPKRVNILEKGINQERVQHVSFMSACGAYKKVHLLVPKTNEKYCYTMYAMIINRNTLDNGRTLPTV
jgi:hypothetical protein